VEFSKRLKKPYTAPAFKMLKPRGAAAELKAKGLPGDKQGQELLSLISTKISLTDLTLNARAESEPEPPVYSNKALWSFNAGLLFLLVSFPLSLLFLFAQTHQILSKVSPFWWGSWAVLALWIIFAKGLPAAMGPEKNILGNVWLSLGVANLASAVGCLCFL
jgi:hypothetical protein